MKRTINSCNKINMCRKYFLLPLLWISRQIIISVFDNVKLLRYVTKVFIYFRWEWYWEIHMSLWYEPSKMKLFYQRPSIVDKQLLSSSPCWSPPNYWKKPPIICVLDWTTLLYIRNKYIYLLELPLPNAFTYIRRWENSVCVLPPNKSTTICKCRSRKYNTK